MRPPVRTPGRRWGASTTGCGLHPQGPSGPGKRDPVCTSNKRPRDWKPPLKDQSEECGLQWKSPRRQRHGSGQGWGEGLLTVTGALWGDDNALELV